MFALPLFSWIGVNSLSSDRRRLPLLTASEAVSNGICSRKPGAVGSVAAKMRLRSGVRRVVSTNVPFRFRVRGMQFSYVTSKLIAFSHPQ